MQHHNVVSLMRREQFAQRTEAWYEVRKHMLTASDVASVLNIKPYDSYKGSPRVDLLDKKLNGDSFKGNMYTRHGVKYEDEACAKLSAAIGEEIHMFGLLRHPDHPWLGASPDGVTAMGKCVEIKCPLRRPIVPGHVPHHYLPQVLLQMEVCDLDVALFCQYRPASHTPDNREILDITVVERDRGWFEKHLPTFKAFYDDFIEKRETHVRPPPPPPPRCLLIDDLYEE